MKYTPIKLWTLLIAGFFLHFSLPTSATIWRINNDVTRGADFLQPGAALANASVVNGDTLHIEPGAIYSGFTLSKSLVIIGGGYFLNVNTGLQVDTRETQIGTITINANGSNSIIMGVRTTFSLTNTSNILITHCRIANLSLGAFSSPATGIEIRKNFFTGSIQGNSSNVASTVTFIIENNIFAGETGFTNGSISFNNNVQGLFRNNIWTPNMVALTLNNFYISNNIFCGSFNSSINGSNNVIRNNLSVALSNLPTGDGNINNVDISTLFVEDISTGTGDARFQLAPGSPAIGAGESISPVTNPDCGAYGATDPYRISGIPPIPTIYLLTVPASVAPTDVSMDITISTRSN